MEDGLVAFRHSCVCRRGLYGCVDLHQEWENATIPFQYMDSSSIFSSSQYPYKCNVKSQFILNAILNSLTTSDLALIYVNYWQIFVCSRRGPALHHWLEGRRHDGDSVTYFYSCAVGHLDPEVGRTAMEVLSHLGYRVEIPSGACCSLLLSTAYLTEAIS